MNEVQVFDPALRVTRYQFSAPPPAGYLTRVINPDGHSLDYTYQGVAGANCGGSSGQLCSATDPRASVMRVTYGASVQPGPFRVSSISDRRGNAPAVSWDPASDSVSVTQGNHLQVYGFDALGRIADVSSS